MKTIMCYGDSNTWGAPPDSSPRMGLDVRWAGVMRGALGAGYWVVEEGLNGRTTCQDDPFEGANRNGRTFLPVALETHAPLDLVIIKLGTNDLKQRFGVPASDIARGVGILAQMVMSSASGVGGAAPNVLLIAPAPLAPLRGLPFEDMFEGGEEKSRQFGHLYAAMAAQVGCAFLDAGSLIRSSLLDGIHLDPPEHRTLGLAVAAKVREIIG